MARTLRPPDWHDLKAPGLATFEAIAMEAYRRLPAAFRDLTREVQIRIDEFPTDEVLDDLGIASELDLLGLYQGVPISQRGATDPPLQPDRVYLYRRPILDYWAEHDITLGNVIVHVLVHEIGHHFGFSDDDMARIEDEAG
ncbi:MAG: metallopeptidase family protein [Hyphomicrobiaceae bacterium]